MIAIAVAVFAVQGGEYGTFDLLRQRSRRIGLHARIDTLRHQVDSLTRLAHDIQTDPAMQERIAREEFGMVRGSKELLYRFAPAAGASRADSARIRSGTSGTALGTVQPESASR
ncbi:MAG: septum formation initiator family protein [Gemmatimonadales bacterium]